MHSVVQDSNAKRTIAVLAAVGIVVALYTSFKAVPVSQDIQAVRQHANAKHAAAPPKPPPLPPCKKFVYLIQAPDHWEDNRLKTNDDRDVLWLSYTTLPPNRSDVTFLPGSSWTEGRNALLEFAMQHVVNKSGAGYEYYTFLDRDFLGMIAGDDPWAAWEADLLSETPAIAYAVESVPWQGAMSHLLPGETCIRSLFNVDAICQAFHRTTLGLALPYDESLDERSIFFSAYISNMEVTAFFPHSRVGFYDMKVLAEKNEHLNPVRVRARGLSYVRSLDWKQCKQYMSGAFLNPAMVDAVNVANCHTTTQNNYCERPACPGIFNRTGPADLNWLKENVNVAHPWAAPKVAFLEKWDEVLSRARTPFVREPDDCAGRSPSGARCRVGG